MPSTHRIRAGASRSAARAAKKRFKRKGAKSPKTMAAATPRVNGKDGDKWHYNECNNKQINKGLPQLSHSSSRLRWWPFVGALYVRAAVSVIVFITGSVAQSLALHKFASSYS